ncbi:hypothetical protein BX616_010123 [Lobosporangium transversale]|uniref:Uncharacterized protein n=1 Tax=Lobosporangium transversale TaxID=64571 RepID=A0A1Y2GJV0_9FUNG|nr:hypothetical protein BCR41DRAFT_92158 [Lobosporangium transversale]KAF9913238.1 hypothetical protein BX616_010123 [Lobosporangium transversale]ORZ13300.1 hypothetical protein BCR41DRAFT_92158 [Lobosporangium transversale]|eukprot:XP_021880381.1 hypothetical protein BCR41DRAFT_92158 [Lobosporangium transversale]
MDTTNHIRGERNDGGNRMKAVTEQDISWMEGSSDKSPTAFFDKFGIFSCEEGHRRYATAIRRSEICEQERMFLISNFEVWKNSESPIYWERRNTKAIANKFAWKTAGNMIRGSEPFVENIIIENANEQRQCLSVPSDVIHVPNTPHQVFDTSHLTPSTKSTGKDHTKRTMNTTMRAAPMKRIRLQDPWHDLADAALHLYKGHAVDLPSEEAKDTEKDHERQKLYGLAWRHLRDAKKALEQQNKDKEARLHFRDAFVALSGVFNLYSPIARKALTYADRVDAKSLCLIPELEHRDKELTKLLNSLKTTKTKKLISVLEDIYSFLSSKPKFRLFLLVLRNIIENILNPHHGDNRPSEADALLIWGSILKDGRPKGTPFTFCLGDQASLDTRVSKSKLACALNTGCSARKCDCTLSIGKVQFGNAETKRASTPPDAVKIQLRKNIKIARSVMLELSRFGLDSPPQLSLHGLQADVFRVVPWKGVFVAAPACDPIVLPTMEATWNLFIENTAFRLKNLLEYYHNYAVDAKEKIDLFNYTQKTIGQEEEGEDEGEGKGEAVVGDEVELIDWSDVIFHTPTKPRAKRSIVGVIKPDNRRFEQKLQEAITELEDDNLDNEDNDLDNEDNDLDNEDNDLDNEDED